MLLFRFGHWKFPLWTGTSDETNACAHVPFPRNELWTVQKDGDLCTCERLTQRAKPATKREMSQFHTDDYVDFLYRVTPDNLDAYVREQARCMWR